MYYVIRQSTDLRCPDTDVRKFTSLAAARRHAAIGNGAFAHADPEEARNWHHVHKTVWKLSGRIDRKDPVFRDRGTPTYPRGDKDNLAAYIRERGEEMGLA